MKKRRLKGWVKKLLIILLAYAIGLSVITLFCWNAEQVDRKTVYEETY
jgi:hypothetical protein